MENRSDKQLQKAILSDPYIPISCNYYDHLEAIATRKEKVSISYFDEDGTQISGENRIIDFRTKDGIEFMILDDEKIIRLDKIISVSGFCLKDFENC